MSEHLRKRNLELVTDDFEPAVAEKERRDAEPVTRHELRIYVRNVHELMNEAARQHAEEARKLGFNNEDYLKHFDLSNEYGSTAFAMGNLDRLLGSPEVDSDARNPRERDAEILDPDALNRLSDRWLNKMQGADEFGKEVYESAAEMAITLADNYDFVAQEAKQQAEYRKDHSRSSVA